MNKELLAEVLKDNEITHWDYEIKIENNLVYYCGGHKSINIYELAHKCKEWAYKNGYELMSSIAYCCIDHKSFAESVFFTEDTEPETIFKACQWILDNK